MDRGVRRGVRAAAQEGDMRRLATIDARLEDGEIVPGAVDVYSRRMQGRGRTGDWVARRYRRFLEDARDREGLELVETQLAVKFRGTDVDGNEVEFWRTASGGRNRGWIGENDELPEDFNDLHMNEYAEPLENVRFVGMSIAVI